MVLLDHSRKELADHPEMGNGIHLESFLDHSVISSKNGHAGTDSGIVYQDRGVAMIPADLCCHGGDFQLRSYIGLIEKDVACCRMSKLALARFENRAGVRFRQDDQGLNPYAEGSSAH